MKRFRAVVLGCSMAFLILGCNGSEPASTEIGDIAPAFSLPAVGQASAKITSDQIQGKITVLNFWSTTCAVCLNEIEELARIHSSGKAVVIGIALEKDAEYLSKFVKDRGISYPVAVGDEDVFSRYEGYAIPYTIVLDRARAIRLRIYGRVEADELAKVIDKIERTPVALVTSQLKR
jgi:peroxiredoxin